MQDTQIRRYEMFTRVSDFGATHAASFPPTSLGGELLAAVNAAVSELDGHATKQASGAGSARQATATLSNSLSDFEWQKLTTESARRRQALLFSVRSRWLITLSDLL